MSSCLLLLSPAFLSLFYLSSRSLTCTPALSHIVLSLLSLFPIFFCTSLLSSLTLSSGEDTPTTYCHRHLSYLLSLHRLPFCLHHLLILPFSVMSLLRDARPPFFLPYLTFICSPPVSVCSLLPCSLTLFSILSVNPSSSLLSPQNQLSFVATQKRLSSCSTDSVILTVACPQYFHTLHFPLSPSFLPSYQIFFRLYIVPFLSLS